MFRSGFASFLILIVVAAVVAGISGVVYYQKQEGAKKPLDADNKEIAAPHGVGDSEKNKPVFILETATTSPTKKDPRVVPLAPESRLEKPLPTAPLPTAPLPTAPQPLPIKQNNAANDPLASPEREIAVLFNDGRPIGPEHYARLKSLLDAALDAGASQERIEKLRLMLEAVSPHNISSAPQPLPPATALTQTSNCASNQSPVFTNHITEMSKVRYVVPPPTMGSGPSLKTHSYIGTDGVSVPIYAPAAMTLKSGSHYVGGPYTIEFQVSCEVTVRFGHVTNPIDAIRNLLPQEPQAGSQTQELSPVSFAAGELIGYTTGTEVAGNWDFGVYNSAVSNRYANDPNWSNSATYTAAVCPFDYFAADMKLEYVAKFNSDVLGGNPPHGESFCRA